MEFEMKITSVSYMVTQSSERYVTDISQVHPILIGGHDVYVKVDETLNPRKGRRGRRASATLSSLGNQPFLLLRRPCRSTQTIESEWENGEPMSGVNMASTTSSIKTTFENLTGEKDSDALMKSFSTYGRKSPRFIDIIDEMPASTRTKIADRELNPGDKVFNFTIIKKIGAGTYGNIYLVINRNDHKSRAALKIEPRMKKEVDERLAIEAHVLSKLQHSKHVCKLFQFGRTISYTYLFMTLLGINLEELRRRLPDRKISNASGLKIAIQVFQALRDVHKAGFVHRDVKPENFAIGAHQKNVIFILDFGLARQITMMNENGKAVLRNPRDVVIFRGINRYCSINVHDLQEPGRHDDLWSALYMLAELVTGTLLWKGKPHKDTIHLKRTTPNNVVFQECPSSFIHIANILEELDYSDMPPYNSILKEFKRNLDKMNENLTDPFEWENAAKNNS
uniref:Protein kinase domain-containing protein n=1 Tax=Acrobeloides nanus TaxID=290746 RepID=A0A914C0U3_9BILA